MMKLLLGLVLTFVLFPGMAAPLDQPASICNLQRAPDNIMVVTEDGTLKLEQVSPSKWHDGKIIVTTKARIDGLRVQLFAPDTAVMYLQLQWKTISARGWKYLGDAWERAYGDLRWQPPDARRIMPWYFLANNGTLTHGYGVKTGSSALCYWTVDTSNITLHADVRCGGKGVRLGNRKLGVCTVVSRCGRNHETPFAAARAFCAQMCPTPRVLRQSIYGFNDWYCTYGHDTAKDFLKDVAMMVSLAPTTKNRPFAVVDDGWELTGVGRSPWDGVNSNFSSTITMPDLAKFIRGLGARPGVWFRPLLANTTQPASWRLSRDTNILDPSVPAVRVYVKQTVRQFRQWGFQMIKHDYTTYDLLGRWGFEMGSQPTTNGWAFADHSRTTAEIIRSLYRDIREAAGDDVLIEGCDTIGHLSAGIFEMQRIGDDTSGRDWSRTLKMGVNSLAFRAPQQGTFFAVDADCVGQAATNSIPWEKNRQWLNLLARSGTTLFVSFAHNAITAEQKAALSQALAEAARRQPVAEPLDWMDQRLPAHWQLDGETVGFHW